MIQFDLCVCSGILFVCTALETTDKSLYKRNFSVCDTSDIIKQYQNMSLCWSKKSQKKYFNAVVLNLLFEISYSSDGTVIRTQKMKHILEYYLR